MIPFVYRRLNRGWNRGLDVDWVMDWTWTKLCLRKEFDRASSRSVLVTVAESRTTSQPLNGPVSPTQPTRRRCVVKASRPPNVRFFPQQLAVVTQPSLVSLPTTRLASTYWMNILSVYPAIPPARRDTVCNSRTFWWQFCEYDLLLPVALYYYWLYYFFV